MFRNFGITVLAIVTLTLTCLISINGVAGFKLLGKSPSNPEDKSIGVRANWPLVQERFYAFDLFVAQVAGDIAIIAFWDEAEVGERILDKLVEYYYLVEDLLYLTQAEIDNKNLTVPVAKEHLGEVYGVIVDFQIEIAPELELLQPSTVEQINIRFANLFLTIPILADEIYAALEEPDAPSCGLTEHRPNEVITPSESTHTDTLPGTVIWFGNVFEVAETFVQLHPHNKYLDSEVTHQSPTTFLLKTTRDFENFIDEMNVTSIHRSVMFLCTDGTSVTNTFEIPVITGPIVEPTLKPILV